MNQKILKVKCPQCQKSFNYYAEESRPFCSQRCRQIDLGHWFQESYVVPLQESVKLEEGDLEEVLIDESEDYNENDYS